MVKDPVCGMEIEAQAAAATRQIDGHTMYFCSEACVAKFDADPGRYGGGKLEDVGSATTGVRPEPQGLVRIELPVLGMTCAKCVATVEQALREETAACSEMVIFSDFNKTAKLPTGETVPIELMLEKPGEYEFACQMWMFRGKLVVE
jgi:YHS domain-containing protein